MKDVINLYAKPGCPKCKVLKQLCEKSEKIKNSDFEIIEVDENDPNDTSLNLLMEKGIQSFPVLLVNNDFMLFDEAKNWVRT